MVDAFEVIHSIVGVAYTPLAAQVQVVAGLNYCFFCQGLPVYPDAESYLAKVKIYASLPDADGKIHYSISQIEPVLP